MSFEASDEALFAGNLRQRGYNFAVERYNADAGAPKGSNGVWYPYHDLKNPRNRIHISLFGPGIHYIADQSAALHSTVLFVFAADTFRMQRWLEESWRVGGYSGRSEYICFMSLFADPTGWGLVDLQKLKRAGRAMTTIYEPTPEGRGAACEAVAAFLDCHLHLKPR